MSLNSRHVACCAYMYMQDTLKKRYLVTEYWILNLCKMFKCLRDSNFQYNFLWCMYSFWFKIVLLHLFMVRMLMRVLVCMGVCMWRRGRGREERRKDSQFVRAGSLLPCEYWRWNLGCFHGNRLATESGFVIKVILMVQRIKMLVVQVEWPENWPLKKFTSAWELRCAHVHMCAHVSNKNIFDIGKKSNVKPSQFCLLSPLFLVDFWFCFLCFLFLFWGQGLSI